MAESLAQSLQRASVIAQASSGSANLALDAPEIPTLELLGVLGAATLTTTLAGGPLAGGATLLVGAPALVSDGYARGFQSTWNRTMSGFANLRGRYSGEKPLTREEFDSIYQGSPLEWDEEEGITREAADLKLLSMHREAFVGRMQAHDKTGVVAPVLGNLLGGVAADPTTYLGISGGYLGSLSLNKLIGAAKNVDRARKIGIGVGAAGSVLEIGGSVWAAKMASESIGDEFSNVDIAFASVLGVGAVSLGVGMGLSRAKREAARKAGETPVDGTVEILAESIDEGVEVTVEQAEKAAKTPVKVVRDPEEPLPASNLVNDGTENPLGGPSTTMDLETGKSVHFRNDLEALLYDIANIGEDSSPIIRDEVAAILVKAGYIDATQAGGANADALIKEASELMQLVVDGHARREGLMTFLDDSGLPDVWSILDDAATKVAEDADEVLARLAPSPKAKPKKKAVQPKKRKETVGETDVREAVESLFTASRKKWTTQTTADAEQVVAEILVNEGFIDPRHLNPGVLNGERLVSQLALSGMFEKALIAYSKGDVSIWQALDGAGKETGFEFLRPLPNTARTSQVVPTAKPKIKVSAESKKKRRSVQGGAVRVPSPEGTVDLRNRVEAALYRFAASDSDDEIERLRENLEDVLMDSGFLDDVEDLGIDIGDVIPRAAAKVLEAVDANADKGLAGLKGTPSVWKVLENAALEEADDLVANATKPLDDILVDVLDHRSAKASSDAVPDSVTPRGSDEVAEEIHRIKGENPDMEDDLDKLNAALQLVSDGVEKCL